jgi:hypothetical protein
MYSNRNESAVELERVVATCQLQWRAAGFIPAGINPAARLSGISGMKTGPKFPGFSHKLYLGEEKVGTPFGALKQAQNSYLRCATRRIRPLGRVPAD